MAELEPLSIISHKDDPPTVTSELHVIEDSTSGYESIDLQESGGICHSVGNRAKGKTFSEVWVNIRNVNDIYRGLLKASIRFVPSICNTIP